MRLLLGTCRDFPSHCSSPLPAIIYHTKPQPVKMLACAVLAQSVERIRVQIWGSSNLLTER